MIKRSWVRILLGTYLFSLSSYLLKQFDPKEAPSGNAELLIFLKNDYLVCGDQVCTYFLKQPINHKSFLMPRKLTNLVLEPLLPSAMSLEMTKDLET